MKRNIEWLQDKGPMAGVLMTPERRDEIERFTGLMIERKASLKEIIEALNERGDLTDNEWTATVFVLGYFNGINDT